MEFQRTPGEDGQSEFIRFGPHMHHLPIVPEGMETSEPVAWLDTTYQKLGEVIDRTIEIGSDKRLSDLGKSERLEPLHGAVHEEVAKLSASLDRFEADLDTEEAAMFAVPELHPQAAVLGQRDVEIRQWFRSLDNEARLGVLSDVTQGKATLEIELALLRTPVAMFDHEAKMIWDRWKDRKRAENPAQVLAIEQKRKAIERSRRAVGMLSATLHNVTRWDQPRIIARLIASDNEFARKGFKAFGIDEGRFLQAEFAHHARSNDRLMGRTRAAA